MKGQGNKKEDSVVVGDKDKNNISNSSSNNNSVVEEEDDEFETTTDEEDEEEDVDGEEEVGINASMVVNLSESQSQLNFNSFSFNNRTNPNDSTITSSTEEDSESNSPLASSRSAPPDIRDYSSSSSSTNNSSSSSHNNNLNNNNSMNTETTTNNSTDNTTSTIIDKEHNNDDNAPSTPALNISTTTVGTNNSIVGSGSNTGTFLNNEKPTFTSTPKQPTSTGISSQQQQKQQINGGNNNNHNNKNNSNPASTPTTSTTTTTTVPTTTSNDNNIVNESGTVKKKLSVTFADIVKTGGTSSENVNIPNKILDNDESDDDDEEEDNDEDFSDSVYFSMGQTPPSAKTSSNNTSNNDDVSVNQRPLSQSVNNDQQQQQQDDTSKINDSSFDVSVNNQSELDMASVSARLSGHDDSMVTLMNVSSCNASALSNSDVNSSSSRSLLVNNSKVCGAGDGPNNVIDDEAADEEVHKINANLLLPHTVTELVADNGVKVYVVGTAHFSEQSQKDVMETIQKLQPTLVVLELCHSRRNILTLDEETILRDSADMSLSKVKETINQSGAVQGTLHLLLLSMSAQLTKKLGMAPGGEFRAAVKEARNIPGCLLLLGDRPIKVTLSRALAALSLGQKLKLAWQFLTSNEDITKDEIERCKEKDLLERMMMEMTGEFPAISRVFVNERDIYLAHSLWLAATSRSHPNHGGPVVGVVGMGHVSGIVRHWGTTTEEHIAELISIPEPTMTSIVVRASLKISFYALVGYGLYKITQRVFDYPPRGFIHNTLERLPDLASKSISRFR